MENNELYHYGVKGMRWGVRKARQKERAALNFAAKAATRGRREEGLARAEKYRKQADDITRAHYKAKAEKKHMKLNKDGSITEMTREDRMRGVKIAGKIVKGTATTAALAGTVAIGVKVTNGIINGINAASKVSIVDMVYGD